MKTIWTAAALLCALGCGNARQAALEEETAPVAKVSAQASAAPPVVASEEACRKCEETHCRNFQRLGIDLVAGCYENPDPGFVQRCKDVLACARQTKCAFGPTQINGCYCGSASSDDCRRGINIDGPCRGQIEAASGTIIPNEVGVNITKRTFPMGNATFLLRCDAQSCADVCVPR